MLKSGPRNSLNDLEGTRQPEAAVTSMLARTIRYHRQTPIEQLGTEALRLLLQEGESVDVLLRVAIDRLERNPFLAGDFHRGDLLVAVLHQPPAVWVTVPDLRARAYTLAEDTGELVDLLEPEDRKIVDRAIGAFKARWRNGGADG